MPFAQLEFRYPWRPYQERILGEIDRHLDDERLHVVAAPGAGKTTLGLEIFRRLARPGHLGGRPSRNASASGSLSHPLMLTMAN